MKTAQRPPTKKLWASQTWQAVPGTKLDRQNACQNKSPQLKGDLQGKWPAWPHTARKVSYGSWDRLATPGRVYLQKVSCQKVTCIITVPFCEKIDLLSELYYAISSFFVSPSSITWGFYKTLKEGWIKHRRGRLLEKGSSPTRTMHASPRHPCSWAPSRRNVKNPYSSAAATTSLTWVLQEATSFCFPPTSKILDERLSSTWTPGLQRNAGCKHGEGKGTKVIHGLSWRAVGRCKKLPSLQLS